MFLTREEITEMTGKQQYRAQAKVLNTMGIIYKVRPDGTLLVLRSHVIDQLGGSAAEKMLEKRFEPNWAALAELQTTRPKRKSEKR